MLEEFKDHPETIWQSGQIADMCDFKFETGKLFFPQFEIPKELTQEQYFAQLSKTGLENLFDAGRIDQEKKPIYHERLEIEVELICKMGFVGYFLVVSDFIMGKRNVFP